MKKLVFKMLVLFSIAIMSSCSSNDDDTTPTGAKKEIKMTIDGKELTFNSITVDPNSDTQSGLKSVQLTGTINNSTDKVITIKVYKSKTGTDTLSDFTYIQNGTTYYFGSIISVSTCGNGIPDSKMTFVTSVNDGTTISGNFSGNIDKCNNNVIESLKITNGSFSASY
ncbi:hypothetical protein [Tenacibaculum aiptasiae]|uniref:hypothetical protein n=1 Tax=Tenacibaculum aiptasiae TaxID=426481 RepID=UPI00232F3B70|nr:hypothetical protein [Tenacibaculum aiptasiae]